MPCVCGNSRQDGLRKKGQIFLRVGNLAATEVAPLNLPQPKGIYDIQGSEWTRY